MSPSSRPPGDQRMALFRERVREVDLALSRLAAVMPNVNDLDLRAKLDAVRAAASIGLATYATAQGPSVADHFSSILTGLRVVEFPVRDPDAEFENPTIEALRDARARLLAALMDTLAAAEALGWAPSQSDLPVPISLTVAPEELHLGAIAARLDSVDARLTDVARSMDGSNGIRAQYSLVNFYVAAVRVELSLARMQLKVGGRAIDFATLARAVEAIADITGDFLATIHAWTDRVAATLRQAAIAMERPVRRLTKGIAVAATWIGRRREKLRLSHDISTATASSDLLVPSVVQPSSRDEDALARAHSILNEAEPDSAHLELAIAAFRAALSRTPRAQLPLEWASLQNSLGTALETLGRRESGSARLDQAVAAYRVALEERTRDRVPLDWAMTQNNLGNALATLGERESGTARLEDAITAYRAALAERPRDRSPLGWAASQNNLGAVLQTLGERESNAARLEQAVAAYHAALEVHTRERVPLLWAATQNNIGVALQTLGQLKSDTARLEEAVAAYRNALEEWTRDRVSLDWAMTQNNLGNALRTIGARESGTARLTQAVTAYRAALEEWTRDRIPLRWATTQDNLAHALRALDDRAPDLALLDQAIDAWTQALTVLDTAAWPPEKVAAIRAALARVQADRARRAPP